MTRTPYTPVDRGEYAPFYETYVSAVPDGPIVTLLEEQGEAFLTLLRGIPEERGTYRYAPGKWSINELIGHLVDTERVFGYRALCFARNDPTPLPGFDQDQYVAGAGFDAMSIASLAGEFEGLRKSHLYLFGGLDPEAWERRGTANGSTVSVGGIAYIMAGHVYHHVGVLQERYLRS